MAKGFVTLLERAVCCICAGDKQKYCQRLICAADRHKRILPLNIAVMIAFMNKNDAECSRRIFTKLDLYSIADELFQSL